MIIFIYSLLHHSIIFVVQLSAVRRFRPAASFLLSPLKMGDAHVSVEISPTSWSRKRHEHAGTLCYVAPEAPPDESDAPPRSLEAMFLAAGRPAGRSGKEVRLVALVQFLRNRLHEFVEPQRPDINQCHRRLVEALTVRCTMIRTVKHF